MPTLSEPEPVGRGCPLCDQPSLAIHISSFGLATRPTLELTDPRGPMWSTVDIPRPVCPMRETYGPMDPHAGRGEGVYHLLVSRESLGDAGRHAPRSTMATVMSARRSINGDHRGWRRQADLDWA